MMDIVLTQKQGQILSSQMIQSVEILQMPTQELMEYLQTAIQENPVLELQEHYDRPDEPNDLLHKLEWLESSDPQNRNYYHQDFEMETDLLLKCGTTDDRTESLYDHLITQINALELPPETAACARFVAECLNSNGWLDESIAELAQELGQPEKLVEHALNVVQSLDPPGVAARNLSECLCLQLVRCTPKDALAIQIAKKHLDPLSRDHHCRQLKHFGNYYKFKKLTESVVLRMFCWAFCSTNHLENSGNFLKLTTVP